ncbi:MAG: acetyl-CoA carboxylase biotin carboxylase subunit [Phycisphaerales bacterium]|nr:acetyl-CoA carboxylase biotin carboxylase subunit [Phycisphaerae bacterium]NNF43101.1 acetyl-CoA carboxylase biotin carboxylase subunit [Phycisphaerales bacterium]NNM27345.1 acetyl-CoA carboxylase biotin carboxylase subunit [Phycisphaerales bacterium]
MFAKVLIANRGEIAVRIIRTLREMGVASVAVYSDPDRTALHVQVADEAYPLPGTTAAETYLQAATLIEIARSCGADAIHPGYGFLSENADFARACVAAGITFVGPPPDAIAAMGDKIIAKRLMEEAGVPVVPGWVGAADAKAATVATEASKIGYPVLVKAAAGGGGKGMRVVEDASALAEACAAARREAGAAFGDDRIFLEKYLPHARHVEFQVLADTHGAVTHLAERECSIQRRHQKIVEEAPAPGLAPAVRARMAEAAVRAAAAIGYANAGTVEFMLADDGAFYFLEVNTRLQVEHPVTELILGRDLVRDQIEIAAGAALPVRGDETPIRGHAIECRVYAEDPARNFLPSTGRIHYMETPDGPGVRVDSGVATGSEVSVHYDPMLAKLIAWAPDRGQAITRMRAALARFVVLGVITNIEFLQDLLGHPAFVAGDLHTRFLEEHSIGVTPGPPTLAEHAVAAFAATNRRRPPAGAIGAAETTAPDPWSSAGRWRGGLS